MSFALIYHIQRSHHLSYVETKLWMRHCPVKLYVFLCGNHDTKAQLLKAMSNFHGDSHELLHRSLYRHIVIQVK